MSSQSGKIKINCICGKTFEAEDEIDFHYQFKNGFHTCPHCGHSGWLQNPLAVFDD